MEMFKDGERLCIVSEEMPDAKTTAKLITQVVMTAMKNADRVDTALTVHTGSDGFAVTLTGVDEASRMELFKAFDMQAVPDVTEARPVKEKKRTAPVSDVRIPSGKYKGMTPKECVEKDRRAALVYLQNSVISMEGKMPASLEEAIRKQLRAYMHRYLSRVTDPAGWAAQKDGQRRANCDTFLKEGFLIIPKASIVRILNGEGTDTYEALWKKATSMRYKERQAVAAAIITEFLKK